MKLAELNCVLVLNLGARISRLNNVPSVKFVKQRLFTLLATSITYWNTPGASKKYGPIFAADQQKKLAGFKTDVENSISLPIPKMAPP